MRAVLRAGLDVVLRVLLLVAIDWVFGWLVIDVLSDAEDADIGGGILVMCLIAGVASLVALRDGARWGVSRALLVWVLVAVLAAAATTVRSNLVGPGDVDLGVLRSDLLDPFWTLWIGVPACAGAVLGGLMRRGARS